MNSKFFTWNHNDQTWLCVQGTLVLCIDQINDIDWKISQECIFWNTKIFISQANVFKSFAISSFDLTEGHDIEKISLTSLWNGPGSDEVTLFERFLKTAISEMLKSPFFKQMDSNLLQFQVLICMNVMTLKNEACPACGLVLDQSKEKIFREIGTF